MADRIINKDALDKIDIYPPREVDMSHEQVIIIRSRKVDSSMIVNGGPGTGKTTMAIMEMVRLSREGKKCLYIAPTSLSLKYTKHAFCVLGLHESICSSYYEFEEKPTHYDIVLLDDSQRYTLEQIQRIKLSSTYQFLFGDYNNPSKHKTEKAGINEVTRVIQCNVFNLSIAFKIPSNFLKLIPSYPASLPNLSLSKTELPCIAEIASFEDQCKLVKSIIKTHHLEDVGILCYTRELVKSAYDILNTADFPIETYLPGKRDYIDTINLDSGNPKIFTIASCIGIHFRTVFVIGFDKQIVFNNPEEAIKIAVSRPTENLYIFYQGELPEPLASLSKDIYQSNMLNDEIVEL